MNSIESRSAARALTLVTIVVPDYDAAIIFFTGVLGFRLVEDIEVGPDKRWVVVTPGEGGAHILCAKAASDAQRARIGDQTGGRVAFFLETDDFQRDHAAFAAKGLDFIEPPRQESYGRVAKFRDPFGNLWDLLERSGS